MRGGYLRERQPGVWRLEYSVDGRREHLTVYARTRKVAWQAAQEARRAKLAERPKSPADWTVSEFLAAWLADKLPSCRTVNTGRNYQRQVAFWQARIGHMCIHDTQAVTLAVLAVKAELLTAGRAPSTVIGYMEPLKQAGKWARDLELIAKDPVAKVKLPELVIKRPRQAYDLEQAARLDAVLRPPYGAAVALGLWAGLRMGEAIAVRIKRDVDFARHLLQVEEQLVRIKGQGMQFAPPKDDQRRTVQLSATLERHIRAQLVWNRETQLARRGAWRGQADDLLTTTEWGSRVAEATVREYLKTACSEASVPYFDFHALRHTYATLLRRAHVSDADIAPSLGHRNTLMLQRLYGNHPDEQRHERLARALDAMTAGGTTIDEQADLA